MLRSLSPASLTGVTVTVWGVLQFDCVKVSDEGETVAAPVSPLDTVTVTLPVRFLSSATVKEASSPRSNSDSRERDVTMPP